MGISIRRAVSIFVLAAAAAPVGSSRAQDLSVMLRVRDGVALATDVYFPDGGGQGPWPVLLTRTRYDKRVDSVDPEWLDDVSNRGYVYVVQDTRGRFASDGVDSTFWTDGWGALQDGYDTIEWIAAQSWCDGNVGMHGWSARGIVQYLAAGAVPPSLKACMAVIACEDFYSKAFFQGGELRKSLVEGWFASQDAEYMLPFFLSHSVRDAFWDTLDIATRAALVSVPILHVGGFYDVFGESAIDAFNALQLGGGAGAAGNQRLVLGPWTHDGVNDLEQGQLTYPPQSTYDLGALRWRWYDHWLKGVPNGVEEEPAVSYFLMGDVDDPAAPGNQWIHAETFPPAVEATPLYLHGPASLFPVSLQFVPSDAPEDGISYSNDPSDPVMTLGGRNLFFERGPYDQRPVHGDRMDGLSLTTAPLREPIQVVGKVRARFWASCSVTDADWCAMLIDAYPDGREMLVTDGVLRARFREGFGEENLLVPGETYEFDVDLWSTAITFDRSHRIVLWIANSNYPRFEINPQSGAPFGAPGDTVAAEVTVWADAAHPSHLLLPIVTGTPVGVPFEISASTARVKLSGNPASRFDVRLDPTAVSRCFARVFDAEGRAVREIAAASPGGSISWDGRDAAGRPAPAGVYYLDIRTETSRLATTRLVLLR